METGFIPGRSVSGSRLHLTCFQVPSLSLVPASFELLRSQSYREPRKETCSSYPWAQITLVRQACPFLGKVLLPRLLLQGAWLIKVTSSHGDDEFLAAPVPTGRLFCGVLTRTDSTL
ncbi:hypothetical protein LIA77_05175 [Sarocladium implicatum]|nr:hypothetical protein LIA77_05175 [Sarocladium implicatum]